MTMVFSNIKYQMKGCFGNPQYYVGGYCYALRCPWTVECKIERKKNRGNLNNG